MGVAVAVTGLADDPSAVWFNPAGITSLKGRHVAVGYTAIVVPATQFTGRNAGSLTAEVTEEAKSDLFTPIHFYLVSDLGTQKLRVGLGVNSPFGLAKRWYAGSTFASDVVTMGLTPVVVNPNVAYQVLPQLSVAAGFSFLRSGVTLTKAPYSYSVSTDRDLSTLEGDRLFTLDMEGSGTGTGFNAALLGRLLDGKLGVGLSYRSKIEVEFEGDASFGSISTGFLPVDVNGDGVPDPVPVSLALFGAQVRNAMDEGSATVPFPALLKAGVSYQVMQNLTFTADYDVTFWSSYDTLAVEFERYAALSRPQAKLWDDSAALRLGALYRVNPWLELGAGFLADKNPVPDETIGAELPDTDRTGLTLGATVGKGQSRLSIGFLRLMMEDRETNNLVQPSRLTNGVASYQQGTFKSSATLFGITLTHAL